jgi:hypothetical protein
MSDANGPTTARKFILVLATAFTMMSAVSGPALAHDRDNDGRRDWRAHERHEYWWHRHHPYGYRYAPGYVYAPPPVIYAPPPPAAIYAPPPPVVYAPPAAGVLSFGFNFR